MLDARRHTLVALIIGLAAAAGCSDINPLEATSTTAPARQRPIDVNDADVEFLSEMIGHLRTGEVLITAALDPTADAAAQVTTLANHIGDENAGRVVRMTDLLERWGEPAVQVSTLETVPALTGLTGADFDEQWKSLMLDHHARSAVLAGQVRAGGSSRIVDNLAAGMLIDLGFEAGRLEESIGLE